MILRSENFIRPLILLTAILAVNLPGNSAFADRDPSYTGTIEAIEYSRDADGKLKEIRRAQERFLWHRAGKGEPKDHRMGLSDKMLGILNPGTGWSTVSGYVFGGKIARLGELLDFNPVVQVKVSDFSHLKALYPNLTDSRRVFTFVITGSPDLPKDCSKLVGEREIEPSHMAYMLDKSGLTVIERQFLARPKDPAAHNSIDAVKIEKKMEGKATVWTIRNGNRWDVRVDYDGAERSVNNDVMRHGIRTVQLKAGESAEIARLEIKPEEEEFNHVEDYDFEITKVISPGGGD